MKGIYMLDRKAARLFIISFLLYLGLSMAAGAVLTKSSSYTLMLLFNAFVISVPAFLMPALFFRSRNELEPYRLPDGRLAFIAVLMGVGCMFLNLALVLFGQFVTYGIEISSTALNVRESLEGSSIWIMLLTVVLIPAVSEEFLMRGTLLEVWRRTSPRGAVILTAVLFGLIHLAPSNFLVYFAMGVLFAEIYLLTRNVWLTVIVHAMNNLLSVLSAQYYLAHAGTPEFEAAQETAISQGQLFFMFLIFALIAAAVIVPLYYLMRSVCRKNGIGAYALPALGSEEASVKVSAEGEASSPAAAQIEEQRGLFRQPLVWVALITLIALNVLFGLIELGVIKLG